jgi:hypothetical protein
VGNLLATAFSLVLKVGNTLGTLKTFERNSEAERAMSQRLTSTCISVGEAFLGVKN